MSETEEVRARIKEAEREIDNLRMALAEADKNSGKFEAIAWAHAFKVGSRVRWLAARVRSNHLPDRLGTVTRITDALHVKFDEEKGEGIFDAGWFRAYPRAIIVEPESAKPSSEPTT